MSGLENFPEWLGAGLLGAVIAALGYVAKLFLDFGTARQRAHAERNARLLELNSLLMASQALFASQRRQSQRLDQLIRERLPEQAPAGLGYERMFSSAYDQLTVEEKDLHDILRSTTQHAVRALNSSLSTWLRTDQTFKVGYKKSGHWPELAAKLNQLEAHLFLWHAKYEAWIPNRPEHALVYLADEEAHGVGFPAGLDALVSTISRERNPHRRAAEAASGGNEHRPRAE